MMSASRDATCDQMCCENSSANVWPVASHITHANTSGRMDRYWNGPPCSPALSSSAIHS